MNHFGPSDDGALQKSAIRGSRYNVRTHCTCFYKMAHSALRNKKKYCKWQMFVQVRLRALKTFCGKCPKRFSYFSCEKWWKTITSAWLVVNTYTLTQIRVNFVFRACVGFWRLWFNLAGKLAHRVWLMLRPDMTLDHISWRKIRHQLFIMLKWQLLS